MSDAMITPVNWASFQHYSKRNPPWIKLHRSLLDDPVFQCLPVASKALAPMLWLQASTELDGVIRYTTEQLAFRFRMPYQEFMDAFKPLVLTGLFVDASSSLADCKHDARPETEAETKAEAEKDAPTKRMKTAKPKSSVPAQHLDDLNVLCSDWPRFFVGDRGKQVLRVWSDPADLWDAMNKNFPSDDPALMIKCGLVYLDQILPEPGSYDLRNPAPPKFCCSMMNFYGPKFAYWKLHKEKARAILSGGVDAG